MRQPLRCWGSLAMESRSLRRHKSCAVISVHRLLVCHDSIEGGLAPNCGPTANFQLPTSFAGGPVQLRANCGLHVTLDCYELLL